MPASLVNAEVPFGFGELFFSRTDPHGIIHSSNNVFRRISGYGRTELSGKPHKIIRHPDMPRGVFQIFWDTIKMGAPIAAYVKNRAKDGRFYWVFAITMPLADGYLSVRLKPSSDLFAVVQQEYEALRERERGESLLPEQSAAALEDRLKELGFRNYRVFMAEAIARELAAQDEKLKRQPDQRLSRFVGLVKLSASLLEQAGQIFEAYDKNRHVSLNFQVQAAQLGAAGGAIGQISKNYDLISAEIKNNLNSFVESAEQVFATANAGQFLLCATRIQEEMQLLFEAEAKDSADSEADEIPRLQQQSRHCLETTISGLESIVRNAQAFRNACEDMKRLSAALEVTRIMGKVESARGGSDCDSLRQLVDELDILQQAISASLKEISSLDQLICHDIERLLADVVASRKRVN